MYDVTPLIILLGNVLEPMVEQAVKKALDGQESPTTAPDADQWQQGAEFAAKELGLKVQTVYQQIDKIPHRKIHGKLYFKRSQLQNYIEQKGGQAQ